MMYTVPAHTVATWTEGQSSGPEGFIRHAFRRISAESVGAAILEDLGDLGVTVRQVSDVFWDAAVHMLPEDLQQCFEGYVKRLAGIDVRAPISVKDGMVNTAGSIREIADLVADNIYSIWNLVDSERGYVALMAYANEIYTGNTQYRMNHK